MHTNSRARLVLRLRKFVFFLPLVLPAGIALSVRLAAFTGRATRIPWLLEIPAVAAALGWIVLTTFVSARAAVRILHIRRSAHTAMAIPAILLGLILFGSYTGFAILSVRLIISILAGAHL